MAPRADLANNGETFGTQGAVVCVIVMVKKADGTLFCGHMDCGYSGQPGNQQAVTDGARALVQAALPNDQATVNWWLAGRAGGPN